MNTDYRNSTIGNEQFIPTLTDETSTSSRAAHQNVTSILTAYQDASRPSADYQDTTAFQDMLINISSTLAFNSTSNDNTLSDPEVPETFMGVYFTTRVLMSLLAIGGNGLTIVAIIKFDALRNTTNMLVANLAVADMITGLLMPVVISHHLLRDMSIFIPLCLVEKTLSLITIHANLIFILWIALDRYFYIAHPLKYVLWMTPKRTYALIFLTWFYISANSTLVMVFANVLKMGGTCKLALVINPRIYIRYLMPQVYICFPLTIACYAAIARIAVKQSRAIAALNQPFDTIEASINRRQWKIAKMMFTVLASHLLSWTPQTCLSVIIQNRKTTVTLALELVTTIIFYTNSFLNPIIYAWKSKEFNVGFRKLLKIPNPVTPYHG